MKHFFLSILLFSFYLSADCQTQATPKTYFYLSEQEEWRLTIFDFKTFELLVRKRDDSYSLMLDGNCILTDSTIQLVFTSSVTLDFFKKDTTYGPNVREFIKGSFFKRVNDYIIPKIIPDNTKTSDISKPNIFKRYLQKQALDMGGTEITFDDKKRYTLIELFCTGKFTEKGKYIQSGNIVTLFPGKKPSFSSTLMDNNILFANEELLISRKIQRSRQPDRFKNEEVFFYFFRR